MSNSQSRLRPDLMKPLPALPSPKHSTLQIIEENPEQERESPRTPMRRQIFPPSPPFELHTPNYTELAGKVRPSHHGSSNLKSLRRMHALITPDSSPDHGRKKPKACLSHVESSYSRPSAYMPLVSLETNGEDIDIELLERLTASPSSDSYLLPDKRMTRPPRDLGLGSSGLAHKPFTRKTPAANLHRDFKLTSGTDLSGSCSPDGQCDSSCHSLDFWTEDDDIADWACGTEGRVPVENSDTEMVDINSAHIRPSFVALLLGIDKLRSRV